MTPRSLDHVALWVAGRDAMVEVATERLGLRTIERTDSFTLLGADARRGKLTLFDADGPREQGALKRIGLRVSSLDGREERVDLGESLEVVLVEAPTDSELDLDHVGALLVRSRGCRAGLAGVRLRSGRREQGRGRRRLHRAAPSDSEQGDPGAPERPLLNHIGVLVDSVEEHIAEAEDLGIEIDNVVDAENTLALFVWGPDRVKLEYVEHKASFSLR